MSQALHQGYSVSRRLDKNIILTDSQQREKEWLNEIIEKAIW